MLFILTSIIYNPISSGSISHDELNFGIFVDLITAIIFLKMSFNYLFKKENPILVKEPSYGKEIIVEHSSEFPREHVGRLISEKENSKREEFDLFGLWRRINDFSSARKAAFKSVYVCLWLAISEFISIFDYSSSVIRLVETESLILSILFACILLFMAYSVGVKERYYLNPLIMAWLVVMIIVDALLGVFWWFVSLVLFIFGLNALFGYWGLSNHREKID